MFAQPNTMPREKLSESQCEALDDHHWVSEHTRGNLSEESAVTGHCRENPSS